MGKKNKNKNKNKVEKFYNEITIGRHEAQQIPEQLTLPLSSPGIHLGCSDSDDAYIGIPQGSEGNLLIVGSNGSGKTVGIAKPTLWSWTGTACVLDIKGELTQEYQRLWAQGIVARPYIKFDPSSADTPCFDPFLYLELDSEDNLMSNVDDLTRALIPDNPDAPEPFWCQAEQSVLSAAMLYGFKCGMSFSETMTLITSTPTSELCKLLRMSNDTRILMKLGEIDANPKMLASVDRGLRNHLAVFAADPCIAHAFRGRREGADTLNWEDLESYTVFLCVPADKLDVWGPCINMMIAQLIRYLERRPEKYGETGRSFPPILMLFDEFARLGRLPMLGNAMATLRSKNVFFALIVQSLAQLDKTYGEYERRIIVDNCLYIGILRANDADTQRYLTELIGSRLRKQLSLSEQMDMDLNTTGYSRLTGAVREELIQPCELSSLTDILLLTPYGFCRVDKLSPDHDLFDQLWAARWKVGLCVQKRYNEAAIAKRKRNDGSRRLTVEERRRNVLARTLAFEERLRQEREQRRREQMIDMLIEAITTTPLDPISTDADRLRRYTAVLADLADDQAVVKQLTERARHRTTQPDFSTAP